MKLRNFSDSENQSTKMASIISVHRNGLVRFSKDASELLGLDEMTSVEILQDETKLKHWFLKVNQESDTGFALKKKKYTYGFSSTVIRDSLKESFSTIPIIWMVIGSEIILNDTKYYQLTFKSKHHQTNKYKPLYQEA